MSVSAELFDFGPGPTVCAARVLVDVDLPHLDHLLDYRVPDALEDAVRPGVLVKVPLSGRTYHGWVIERTQIELGQRVVHPITSVVSTVPVLNRATYDYARFLAKRHAATTSQVLSLVVPARHAGAEKQRANAVFPWEHADDTGTPDPVAADVDPAFGTACDAWQMYEHGDAFLRALAVGHTPRAVWSALPGSRDQQLVALLALTLARGQRAVVVMPTQAQARAFFEVVAGQCDGRVALYHSDLSGSERYGTYLDALCGAVDIVIGTRAAAWLPLPRLGLMVVWDDGDDRLREQRTPRLDSLDVCVARVHCRPAALLVGAWARSVKAQALVASGWAQSILALRDYRRQHMPRIHVPDVYEMDKEGATALGQMPAFVQRQMRQALENGPVLVHVPAGGYVPRIACQRCRALARCPQCNGQLSVTAQQTMSCTWCARELTQWSCPQCHSTQVRAMSIGSAKTGENLGKAFPGIPLVHSRAGHVVSDTLDRKPRLVVATPGAEPAVEGGYELVVVVDPDAIALRPELWAPEEALRRWMNAFALLAPGGKGNVAGVMDPLLSQSLIRWEPAYLSEYLLRERVELGFFPATTIIALEGPAADVRQVALSLEREVLATLPLTDPTGANTDERVRTLVRVAKSDTTQALDALRNVQQSRSAHKEALVKATVNPPELFQ